MSWNDEPCFIRPTFIDLNTAELKYYLFMLSLDKLRGSVNVSSPRVCVPKEAKKINAKAFKMTEKQKWS